MFTDPFKSPEAKHFVQARGFEIELERKRLSELVVTSGRLIACDLLAAPESEPFEIEVRPGRYPVFAMLAHMRDTPKLAYLLIDFEDNPRVTRWEVAHVTGEEPVAWNDRSRGGFHLETGVGCIMDEVGQDLVLDNTASGDGEDMFVRNLRKKLGRAHRGNGIAWAEMTFGLPDGTNVIAFEANDGIYVTHFGRDADGNVVRAVIDLNVLDFQFTPYGIRMPNVE